MRYRVEVTTSRGTFKSEPEDIAEQSYNELIGYIREAKVFTLKSSDGSDVIVYREAVDHIKVVILE